MPKRGGRDGEGGAARGAAAGAGARGIEQLLELLDHADFTVRISAISTLGELGGERANLLLLGIARDRTGERPEVRAAALAALGKIHGPARYADILEDFICGDSRKVTGPARNMLEEVDPEGFPRRLAERGCLDHGAIGVYGRAMEQSAVPLLGRFIAERQDAGDLGSAAYWGKVYAAVRALGSIGGEDAGRSLTSLDTWLRGHVSAGGGTLRDRRIGKITTAVGDSLELLGKG